MDYPTDKKDLDLENIRLDLRSLRAHPLTNFNLSDRCQWSFFERNHFLKGFVVAKR